jgi:hypothetical protein
LTVHQVVAYNFARARHEAGWTQVETSQRLVPYLGYRLNQAGVSAIEKTYDSERRRNIDTAEVVAFARCFDRPIGWFFLPPPGHSADLVEPLPSGRDDSVVALAASELTALVVGTSPGWQSLLARLAELLETDPRATSSALDVALQDADDVAKSEAQLDERRRQVQRITLARLAGPEDEAVTKMAALLVQLVMLTPHGFRKLRDTDPDLALALLAQADRPHDTPTATQRNRGRRRAPDAT